MRKASRYLLVAEATLLSVPTAFGLIFLYEYFASAVTSTSGTASLSFTAAAVLVLLGLSSFWRLLVSYLAKGAPAARRVSRAWWLIAALMAVISVLAFFAGSHFRGAPWLVVGLGILFLPTYAHLTAEVWMWSV
jgi:hypothetical protein